MICDQTSIVVDPLSFFHSGPRSGLRKGRIGIRLNVLNILSLVKYKLDRVRYFPGLGRQRRPGSTKLTTKQLIQTFLLRCRICFRNVKTTGPPFKNEF